MRERNNSQETGTISAEHADEYEGAIVLTKEQLATVSRYADEEYKMKLAKTAHDDDVKNYAKANGIRPADLKDMINIVNNERDKGGTLEDRERKLEIAREIVDKLGAKPNAPKQDDDE